MDDDEYLLNDNCHVEEDFDCQLDDGTLALTQFRKAAIDQLSSQNNGWRALRLRRNPEFSSNVKNIAVVDSRDLLRSHGEDAQNIDDEMEDDSHSDSDYSFSNSSTIHRNNSSDDEIDEKTHDHKDGGPALNISSSLLEARLRLEEDSRKQLQLMEKKGEKELRQLKLKSQQCRAQMELWKSFIGININLRKILFGANRLPPVLASQFLGNDRSLIKQCSKYVSKLFHSLRSLQLSLIRNNSSVSEAILSQHKEPEDENPFICQLESSSIPLIESRKRRRKESESHSDWIRKEAEAWNALDWTPKRVIRWAFNIADQWASKTSIRVQQTFKVLNQSPSSQITRALRVDFGRLLEKTRLSLNSVSDKGRVLGSNLLNFPTNNEGSPINVESFDDTELYISLLKDTVQQTREDGDIFTEASQVGALSARLKKQDAERRKKEFDRRASKEKKIRYIPIPELLSFMNAEPVKYGICLDNIDYNGSNRRIVDQLIGSLFQDVEA